MAAGEQVAFEPALAHVLAEHFHDAAVGAHVVVGGQDGCGGDAVGDFEQGVEAVGGGFVGAEDAEVAGLHVELHDVAQHAAHDARGFGDYGAGLGHVDRVIRESRA